MLPGGDAGVSEEFCFSGHWPSGHIPFVSVQKKLLVVQVAALGYQLVRDLPEFRPAETVFPAVTSTFQAGFRTAAKCGQHGLVANGLFFPDLTKVLFWEQSAKLVEGPRIWDEFRSRGKT